MTVIQIPDNLPILSKGKRPAGSGEVCAEQAVAWLVSGRLDLGDETDKPSCVQPVLNELAIAVNDRLPDHRRHEMWPVILRQPGTARPDEEPVLSVRLAAWCAEQVLDCVAPGDWQVCRDAITAAQVWADDPSSKDAANAAAYAANAAANAAAYAAYAAANAAANAANAAAYAANAAANAAAYAANAAYAAANAAANAAIDSPDHLLALIAGAQAEHERLTGHVPAPVDLGRLERLGELVGVVG